MVCFLYKIIYIGPQGVRIYITQHKDFFKALGKGKDMKAKIIKIKMRLTIILNLPIPKIRMILK